MTKLKFICIASGSSGNCFYLGTSSYGLLIDAGIGARTICKVLRERGIAIETIMGIFVTHDHGDHIRALGKLSNGRYNIPVYTTKEIHTGISHNYCRTSEIPQTNKRYIHKEETLTMKAFEITPFEIPHDGSDNVGYSIQYGTHNFCFITDIGHITHTVRKYVIKAQHLILEANYDENMLENGPYPEKLKERIRGLKGHLSNRDTAEYLANEYPTLLKNLWLCHISQKNNTHTLAYMTVKTALERIGKRVGEDLNLYTLPRTSPSATYEFD